MRTDEFLFVPHDLTQPIRVEEMEKAALRDLTAVLRLVDAGKVIISAKTAALFAAACRVAPIVAEAGEEVEEELTKADASKKIDELQEKTGRGK